MKRACVCGVRADLVPATTRAGRPVAVCPPCAKHLAAIIADDLANSGVMVDTRGGRHG